MLTIVGDSYERAIGHTEYKARHAKAVLRQEKRTFWERVEEALRERRLPTTKAYVASQLSISPPSINEWTKPGGFPTIERAAELAKHLGVCTEWLLTERGPKRPLPQDAAAQELWNLWPSLDDETKVKLISLAGTAYGRLWQGQDEPAAARPKDRTNR